MLLSCSMLLADHECMSHLCFLEISGIELDVDDEDYCCFKTLVSFPDFMFLNVCWLLLLLVIA
jgi:hypothetical protein